MNHFVDVETPTHDCRLNEIPDDASLTEMSDLMASIANGVIMNGYDQQTPVVDLAELAVRHNDATQAAGMWPVTE